MKMPGFIFAKDLHVKESWSSFKMDFTGLLMVQFSLLEKLSLDSLEIKNLWSPFNQDCEKVGFSSILKPKVKAFIWILEELSLETP